VFKNRLYGDIAGIFIGNIAQGFSVAWWKNKVSSRTLPASQAVSPLI
jgi:hypothetical protein